jgi:hypothetical protein
VEGPVITAPLITVAPCNESAVLDLRLAKTNETRRIVGIDEYKSRQSKEQRGLLVCAFKDGTALCRSCLLLHHESLLKY